MEVAKKEFLQEFDRTLNGLLLELAPTPVKAQVGSVIISLTPPPPSPPSLNGLLVELAPTPVKAQVRSVIISHTPYPLPPPL